MSNDARSRPMTAETIHTCSYECERPECIRAQRDELAAWLTCIRAQRDELAARLTAETSNAQGEVEYEYEVWQDDALQAGGRENDYASAKSEANHYAMMYAQDGPVEVRIYEKRLLSAVKVERDWLAPALEVGSEDGLQAEIEKLRAEVERLNRILGRIVEGDGDSTVTIRAGADAFAAAREYLRED